MLQQLESGTIVEDPGSRTAAFMNSLAASQNRADSAYAAGNINANGRQSVQNSSYTIGDNCLGGHVTYWNSYPIYVCTDKTAKAIEILKALQADKIVELKSVPKFIELVEKISGIL